MAEQIMQNAAGKTIPAGYKQTEVGVIPEDWDLTPLGNLIEKIEYGSSSKSHVKGLVPVLRMGNLQDGKINWDDLVFTSNSFEIDKYCLNKGDVLFNRTNSIDLVGKTSIYDGWRKAIFAGYLIRIKTNQLVLDSNYLNFILNTPFARAYGLKVVSVGVSQANINGQKLKTYPIPHPKQVEEQTAIANVLSDSDALIDALEQLIAKKQAIKSATMQQLLTGRTRLPAFTLRPDGTKKGYKPSELGEIPEDWEVMTYGEIFTFLSTSTNSRADLSNIGEYGYIHYGDIHTKFNNALDLNEFNLPRISSHLASSSFVENGDVVMADASEDYEGIGKSVEICNVGSKKVVAGLHTFLLRDKNKYMADGYRGYLHCIPAVKNSFDRLATGMKVYGLSKNNLAVVPVPVPSQKEQTAIATILSDMDNELQALIQKLEKASALKQGMMQQLLTGKIRLPLPPNTTQGASDAN